MLFLRKSVRLHIIPRSSFVVKDFADEANEFLGIYDETTLMKYLKLFNYDVELARYAFLRKLPQYTKFKNNLKVQRLKSNFKRSWAKNVRRLRSRVIRK